MPNDMATAQAALMSQMKTAAGETVTYRRGADEVELSAVIGRSAFEIVDQSGSAMQTTSVDFIIAPDDLVLDSETVTPEPGDEIDRPIEDGKTATYEVRTDGGLDCYQLDPMRTQLRVRARLKAVTA